MPVATLLHRNTHPRIPYLRECMHHQVSAGRFRQVFQACYRLHSSHQYHHAVTCTSRYRRLVLRFLSGTLMILSYYYTVFRKKHRSHFLSYFHELCVDLNENYYCKYTQGKIDSENVEIRYSLRPIMYLWRHICLAKVGASLHFTAHNKPWARVSFFCEYRVLADALRGHMVYYLVEFKII